MTNFQFTQAHIDRLAEAGVEWAQDRDGKNPIPTREDFVNSSCRLLYNLTPRGLLVGTATDLLEKVYGRDQGVQYGYTLSQWSKDPTTVSYYQGNIYSKHLTQEENLIDMICVLSAQLKAKEQPPLTVEQRLERIEKKVGI